MVRSTIVVGLRRCLLSLSLASVLSTRCSVSALSSSPPLGQFSGVHEVSIARTRSAPFLVPSAAAKGRPRALLAAAAAGGGRSEASDGGLVGSPKKAAFVAALSELSRRVARLRRSVLRAAVVLSLLLLGATTAKPAHALLRGKEDAAAATASADVVVADKSSAAARCVKLVVTAGAVAAGAATAKKVLTFDDADGGGGSADRSDPRVRMMRENGGPGGVVAVAPPKLDPSPSPQPSSAAEPLSSEWIEQQLNDAGKETPSKPPPLPSAATSDGGGEPSRLVKDLDSKIEMLRAREEVAKADAERKRLDDIERAAEARRQDRDEVDARIAASAERERAERAQREEERRERLSELERGMKEQQRLEERMREASEENHGGVAEYSQVRTNADFEEARKQPKSAEEERQLKEKYGNMDLEDRAFNILADLGMVDLHADPDSSVWDEDDENAFM